jgi:hypothetical protein
LLVERAFLPEPALAVALWAASGGSIAAIHQTPSFCRTTTPPAEISRTILSASYQEYRKFAPFLLAE